MVVFKQNNPGSASRSAGFQRSRQMFSQRFPLDEKPMEFNASIIVWGRRPFGWENEQLRRLMITENISPFHGAPPPFIGITRP